MLHIVTSVTYSKTLLPKTNYMPGRNLSALRLFHLILISSLGECYYKPHFTDDKNET